MKINKDILRIIHLLLDEPIDSKGVGVATIYSTYDKSRHPHCLTYKNSNTIHKMAEINLIKILKVMEHGESVGMEIQMFLYYKIQFSLKKLERYLRGKSKKPLIKEIRDPIKIFECGKLKIDLSKATMQYKNNPPIEISPDNDEIKFLVLLIERRERLVEYTDIAKTLNLNCYHENVNNKNVARPVQLLKKTTKKVLLKVGLTHKEFKKLIVPKKNIGYILSCK